MSIPEQANIEAGLIVRRTGDSRDSLRQLIPRTTGDPVSLAGAAMGRLALPEPSPEDLSWPGFLREVLLAPSKTDPSHLDLQVVVEPDRVGGAWRIDHLPIDGEPAATLLHVEDVSANAHRFTVALDKSQLERLLREQEVHVRSGRAVLPRERRGGGQDRLADQPRHREAGGTAFDCLLPRSSDLGGVVPRS